MIRYFLLCLVMATVLVVSFAGFRGGKSSLPPLELIPDMDHQLKKTAQEESDFFRSIGNAQYRIPGTVPMGFQVPSVPASAGGKQSLDGFSLGESYVNTGRMGEFYGHGFPEEVRVDEEFIKWGMRQFEIHCSICHGSSGDGNGVIKQYGLAVVSLIDPPISDPAQRPDGSIYDTIVNGKGLMGAYGANLTLKDRWAIVAYVRTLQNARKMPVDDDLNAKFEAWQASQESGATAKPETAS